MLLLLFLVQHVDLAELARQLGRVGAWGLALVLAIYLLAFLVDTLSWQLTLPSAPLRAQWLGKLFIVRTVGEAFNSITPLGGMGGEPVKALLLKRHLRIGYSEALASLFLAKTTNLLALLAFLSLGFYLLLRDSRLPIGYEALAALGLLALMGGVVLFYLVQRMSLASLASAHLARSRLGARVEQTLIRIRQFDERLVHFYVHSRARFGLALLLAVGNWTLGTLELFVVMRLLDAPVSFWDAWIIEAVAQLVRAGTFFIPASIGAQEGAFMVIIAALTGNPVTGLAAALVRRVREAVWIALGLILGWRYSLKPEPNPLSRLS